MTEEIKNLAKMVTEMKKSLEDERKERLKGEKEMQKMQKKFQGGEKERLEMQKEIQEERKEKLKMQEVINRLEHLSGSFLESMCCVAMHEAPLYFLFGMSKEYLKKLLEKRRRDDAFAVSKVVFLFVLGISNNLPNKSSSRLPAGYPKQSQVHRYLLVKTWMIYLDKCPFNDFNDYIKQYTKRNGLAHDGSLLNLLSKVKNDSDTNSESKDFWNTYLEKSELHNYYEEVTKELKRQAEPILRSCKKKTGSVFEKKYYPLLQDFLEKMNNTFGLNLRDDQISSKKAGIDQLLQSS